MFKWPKSWTGVEQKNDGTLIYRERGALSLFFQKNKLKKNKTYIIDQFLYAKLKKIVILEILISVILIAYIKSFSPLSYIMLLNILILGLTLDSITGFLKNILVKRTIKKYAKY